MEELVRKANRGSFKKGRTAWNKGKKGITGRKCGKGHHGFESRPVIALNPDGAIRNKFPSVKAAQEFFGLSDRHSVIKACQQKFFCRGYRLLYEEDYVPWADYRNRRPRFRDIYGRLLKGHHNSGFKALSPEDRQRKSERTRKQALEMQLDPNSKFGKGGVPVPVECTDNGKNYQSIKDCALDLGIPCNQISMAIRRNGTVHGYTIRKIYL